MCLMTGGRILRSLFGIELNSRLIPLVAALPLLLTSCLVCLETRADAAPQSLVQQATQNGSGNSLGNIIERIINTVWNAPDLLRNEQGRIPGFDDAVDFVVGVLGNLAVKLL